MRRSLILVLVIAVVAGAGFSQDQPTEKAKTYKVSGYVLKNVSEHIPNVMVTLVHKDSGEVVGTDKADFFGWFTFKGIPPGVYIVRAENVQRTFAVKNKNVRADIDLASPVGAPDLTKAALGIAAETAKGETGGPGGDPGPTDPRMAQTISGEYYSFSGSTERKVMFCPEGTFFDSSESSYSGTGADSLGNQNMAWGSASQNQGSGKWAIQGTPQSGTITLAYKNGQKVAMKYQMGSSKGCYNFDGILYCYSGPARCK